MSDLYIKVRVCLLLLGQLPCWAVAGEAVWGSVTSENGLSDNSIHCILRDRLGFVWLGSNRGIDRYDGTRVVRTQVATGGTGERQAEPQPFTCMIEEDGEHLLAGGQSGLWRVDKRRLTLQRVMADRIDQPVTRLAKAGNAILMCTPDGVLRLEGGKLSAARAMPPAPPTTFDYTGWGRFDKAATAYLDPAGIPWVGYLFFGADYGYLDRGLFHTFAIGDRYRSRGHNTRSYLLDGTRVLVADNEGLAVTDRASGRVTRVDLRLKRPTTVTAMMRLGASYLLATIGGGIRVVSACTLTLTDSIMAGASVYQLAEHKGRLWACTSKGLFFRQTGTGAEHLFTDRNSQLPDNEVFCIGFDSSGRGLASTRGGLCVYDPESQALSVTEVPRQLAQTGKLRSIERWQGDKLLLIPQYGYPVVYHPKSHSAQTLKLAISEETPSILAVKQLKKGHFIVMTSTGLYLTGRAGFRRFGYIDGLPSMQFQAGSATLTHGDTLWVATTGGLVWADAGLLCDKRFDKIPMVLQEIQTDHWFSDAEVNDVIYDNRLSLSRHDNTFTVRFQPLVYGNTGGIRFRYRLEGYEDEWHLADAERRIFYRNLPVGTYRLNIEAEGMPEMGMTVRVEVPMTNQAILLIVMAVTVIGLVGHILYCHHYKRPYFWMAFFPKPEKYRKNKLTREEGEALQRQLETVMEQKKPYLNPDLQMSGLARLLGCTSHQLSQLFTQQLGRNYYDFIAEYRIKEFKRLAALREYDRYTISALSELCGFRSRNPFLVAFKKHTGTTPREYVKNMREKR